MTPNTMQIPEEPSDPIPDDPWTSRATLAQSVDTTIANTISSQTVEGASGVHAPKGGCGDFGNDYEAVSPGPLIIEEYMTTSEKDDEHVLEISKPQYSLISQGSNEDENETNQQFKDTTPQSLLNRPDPIVTNTQRSSETVNANVDVAIIPEVNFKEQATTEISAAATNTISEAELVPEQPFSSARNAIDPIMLVTLRNIKLVLIYEGYHFSRYYAQGPMIHWQCVNRRCRAFILSYKNKIVKVLTLHNHNNSLYSQRTLHQNTVEKTVSTGSEPTVSSNLPDNSPKTTNSADNVRMTLSSDPDKEQSLVNTITIEITTLPEDSNASVPVTCPMVQTLVGPSNAKMTIITEHEKATAVHIPVSHNPIPPGNALVPEISLSLEAPVKKSTKDEIPTTQILTTLKYIPVNSIQNASETLPASVGTLSTDEITKSKTLKKAYPSSSEDFTNESSVSNGKVMKKSIAVQTPFYLNLSEMSINERNVSNSNYHAGNTERPRTFPSLETRLDITSPIKMPISQTWTNKSDVQIPTSSVMTTTLSYNKTVPQLFIPLQNIFVPIHNPNLEITTVTTEINNTFDPRTICSATYVPTAETKAYARDTTKTKKSEKKNRPILIKGSKPKSNKRVKIIEPDLVVTTTTTSTYGDNMLSSKTSSRKRKAPTNQKSNVAEVLLTGPSISQPIVFHDGKPVPAKRPIINNWKVIPKPHKTTPTDKVKIVSPVYVSRNPSFDMQHGGVANEAIGSRSGSFLNSTGSLFLTIDPGNLLSVAEANRPTTRSMYKTRIMRESLHN